MFYWQDRANICRPCVLVPESVAFFCFLSQMFAKPNKQFLFVEKQITLIYHDTFISWLLPLSMFFFLCVLNGLVHFFGNTPLTYAAWWYHLMIAYLTAMSIYVRMSDFIAFFFFCFCNDTTSPFYGVRFLVVPSVATLVIPAITLKN